jgi:hypothetical protein
MIYFIISNEVELLVDFTDDQVAYFDIYFWIAAFIIFLACFIIYPWIKYRKNLEFMRQRTSNLNSLSFENLDANPMYFSKEQMIALLEDEVFVTHFEQFLEKEYCSESLLFWKSLKIYKSFFVERKSASKDGGFSKSSKNQGEIIVGETKEEIGKSIYDRFISHNAIWQVNIPGIYLKRYQSLKWNDASIYDIHLFDVAEDEVLSLLKSDPFRRFRQTEEFKTQIQRYNKENENIVMMEVIAPI